MKDQCILSCDGFLLLYDIAGRLKDFEEMNSEINLILKLKDEDFVPLVLVGTKCDLEEMRKISFQDGMNLAMKYGIPFFETSSKVNINVEEAIFALVDQICKKRGLLPNSQTEKKEKDCLVM
jgi:GTPase KRas